MTEDMLRGVPAVRDMLVRAYVTYWCNVVCTVLRGDVSMFVGGFANGYYPCCYH